MSSANWIDGEEDESFTEISVSSINTFYRYCDLVSRNALG